MGANVFEIQSVAIQLLDERSRHEPQFVCL